MAEILVNGEELSVRLRGAERLRARRSRLDIPLVHVVTADVDPALGRSFTKGAGPARVLPAKGKRVFSEVRDPDKAVAIELADDRYDLVVVDVEDPRAAVEQIDSAVRSAPQF